MIGPSLPQEHPDFSFRSFVPRLVRDVRVLRNFLGRFASRDGRWRCVWIVILLYLHFLRVTASAQIPLDRTEEFEPFQEVQPVEGLLGNAVIGMVQDRSGYIWIIGSSGFFRYDGYRFLRIPESGQDTLFFRWTHRGLAGGGHGILCIHGSGDELIFYDIDQASARRFQLPPQQQPEDGPLHASSALEDCRGRFLIGTKEGLVYRIEPRTGEIETLHGRAGDRQRMPSGPIAALAEDSSGNIWSGGEQGIVCIEVVEDLARTSDLSRPPGGILPPDSVAVMKTGKDGKILVATRSGEFGVFDPVRGLFSSYGRIGGCTPSSPVRSLVEDPFDNIWIAGEENGLYRWRPGEREPQRFLNPEGGTLSHKMALFSLLIDRSGLLWIGTHGHALLSFAPWRRKFRSSTPSGGDLAGLSGAFVTSAICDRNGTLWVGTFDNDLSYSPRGSKRFLHMRHDPHDPTSLSSSDVTCICERRNGDLWIGTVLGGISTYGPGAGSFGRIQHKTRDPWSLGSDTVNAIFEERDGTVWVGHVRGVDRYEDRTGKFSPFIRWPSESVALTGTAGYFYRDHRGDFWIATAGRGLLRMGRAAGDSVWYRHDPVHSESIPSNSVDCLCEDNFGTLWLGTPAGLSLFDTTAGSFHTYPIFPPGRDVSHGLALGMSPTPGLGVLGIAPDRRGNLWLSTTSGIARFDIAAGISRVFGREDGVVFTQGMRHAMFTTSDGWIYCGGVGGLTWFHPDSVRDNRTPPQIVITGFKILGEHSPLPARGRVAITLDHDHNTFSFEFAALDYGDPQRNQFMYLLEGADNDWVPAGTNRTVTYANVGPGDYVLRVRASNSDGVWNETGLSLPIVIEPPFWQTWWFRGVALILLGALAYGGYRYRLAKVLALERFRLRIANDLHDDIGSDLSGLALESDLIARRLPEGDQGRKRLQTVARTIRSAADNLRDVVWIVSPDQDRVQDLVERIREVAAKMLAGIQYEFRCTGVVLSGPLDVEFKRHVLMMFKEMLHNVVCHARASRVDVEFEHGRGRIRLCVRDDGVGFDPSGAHSGRGLRSLRARASAIGGTVRIESTLGHGTVVCLEADIIRL